MTSNPDAVIRYNSDLVRNIFRQKEEYHRDQAKLPIEEKVKILVELQKISLTIRPKQGEEDTRTVWNIQ